MSVCVCVCVCVCEASIPHVINPFLFPSPVPSITWVYKTNSDAATRYQVATFFDGSVLVLQSVTTDNEGTSTCLVGGVANYSATITVNSKWGGGGGRVGGYLSIIAHHSAGIPLICSLFALRSTCIGRGKQHLLGNK